MRNGAARACLLLVLLIADCARDRGTGPDVPANVVLVRYGGDWQRAPGLAHLDAPLTVRAIDGATLAPIAGLAVRFALDARASGATLSDTLAITNRDGMAITELTLGAAPVDTVHVSARVGHAHERFTVLVTPTPVIRSITQASVGGGDTVTLRGTGLSIASPPGEVRFNGTATRALSASDTTVRAVVPPCLAPGPVSVTIASGGARAEAATIQNTVRAAPVQLAPLGGIVLPADQLSQCVVLGGGGAHYLVVAQIESDATTPEDIDVDVGASGGSAGSFVRRLAPDARGRMADAFEGVLRARESALAAAGPRLASVRAARAVPAPGAIDSFHVIAALDASRFATVRARLVFAGQRVLVWVDTTAPRELTDSVVRGVGRLFDDEFYTLDQDAFGEPSDVDGDGRVHVVLTPVVNTLTPVGVCSLSGFVDAFFSAHDLYPTAPNANGGEFLYGFVPDSVGRFGCTHPMSEFTGTIRTAFVHEFQHLINYNQHVFRRGGKEEEIWLNEGLSHAAEELASKVYERRYPSPSGRTSPDQLFPDSSQSFITYNLINAYLFLRQPYAHSLTHFTEGGTIEERGAAWLFLRWLADRYGDDILRRLVQTPLTGKANVEDKTGESFARLMGDFALAVYADSIPGYPRTSVPPEWRFRTRNWRVIFQRLNVTMQVPPFPIDPLPIPFGGVATGPLRVGGLVMLRVDAPVDAPAVTLRFVPHDATVWPGTRAPQVSIFRLP